MLRSLLLAAGLVAAGHAAEAAFPEDPNGFSSDANCSCGYLDPVTQQYYTEAIFYYFNETDKIDPEIFQIGDYANKKQQGWNSVYKVGAKPYNVNITDYQEWLPKPQNHSQYFQYLETQALELRLNMSDKNHLVNGGQLKTVRQDIQYGSFEASMKGAAQWSGGTAMSFLLRFNSSEGLEIDMLNMKAPELAQVTNLVNGEWPALYSSTNYTVMNSTANPNKHDAFLDFTDVRMDWNTSNVDFWVQGNNTRSLTKKDRGLPQAGQQLSLQTWSTGDKHYMQGPPSKNYTTSHVLYIRAFFNSSTMTADQHNKYNERCNSDQAKSHICATNNYDLRESTKYSEAATKKWTDVPEDQSIRRNAGIVAGCCSTFGILALINAFFRRTPWHKIKELFTRSKKRDSTDSLQTYLARTLPWMKHKKTQSTVSNTNSEGSGQVMRSGASWNASTPGIATPLPPYGARTPASGTQTPAPAYETPRPHAGNSAGLYRSASLASLKSATHSVKNGSRDPTCEPPVPDIPRKTSHEKEQAALHRISEIPRQAREADFADDIKPVTIDEKSSPPAEPIALAEDVKKRNSIVKTVEVPAPTTAVPKAATAAATPAAGKPAPTKRIDYLAGLVAVACMGVTLHHFVQTFWPWVADGYGPGAHYPGPEKWIKIFVGDYILTQLWIGPFFLTATRFLTTNYLKNGNLEDIAKKEVRRAPRLFGPIIIISSLEYFLISMGLTRSLEWLPSVSWSTWPYVVPQPNFGAYLNNLVELGYAMPNMIPEIVQHYCVGVLWTVPVQLQFTYVVLAAAVLIRDIKNPYKRFGFYTLMILSGWYAKSWAACHWCGLVLSDLEATYKWRAYLKARPIALYSVMTGAFVFAAGAPLIAVFSQTFSFASYENSIHPDPATGRPIIDEKLTYPGYNEPTFAVLAFSIGLQILVELSTSVQWFLSTKVVLLLHPHIMTVYLTHGFVMWTWGAWVAVQLNEINCPYWANLLVTLVTTYAFIFALASVLTPLIEFPTQALMRNIDRWMKEEPVAKRRTTAPFTKALVIDRHTAAEEAEKKEA